MPYNPYHIDGQEPTLQKSVFAFMDILGYRRMIEESERSGSQQQMLRRLHQGLNNAREWLEPGFRNNNLYELLGKELYALKAFTDNIVIGWPVRDDAELELGSTFFKVAPFQLEMAVKGFFIRGAISVGEAYVDEVTVFGSALSEAYSGESTLARDPRIILTESAVKAVKKHLTYYSHPWRAPHIHDVLRDSDGQWFVNYLDCILIAEEKHGPLYDLLHDHKTAVERRLEEHKGNQPVWSKYAWVASYHNYFCSLHDRYFSDEHKIDVDLFHATPSLIIE